MAKTTLGELLAQKAALDKQIADAQREERASAIARVKALIADYGLTAADIGSVKPAAGARSAAAGDARAPRLRRKGVGSGRKVAPKYRNPATGDTWSGRGLKPKWLSAELAAGRALADFAL